ncbi:MAG: sulfur oxidation c-type cytochrome SoxA, partial [Rubrivivax sp.]
ADDGRLTVMVTPQPQPATLAQCQALLRSLALAATCALASSTWAADRAIPLGALRSGIEFAGGDVKALQADPAANPAQLWIERGRALWQERPVPAKARPGTSTTGSACQDCHASPRDLRGVAASFPKLHAVSGQLFNLEDQIRHCRAEHQALPAPHHESDDLLALTLLLTQASAGVPLHTPLSPALQPHWRAGEAIFMRRQGQLNLACGHCHDRHWGRRLYTDPLSQGHPNGYPLYRLEWQKPGSLERRLRSCFFGVRADIPPWGDLAMRQLSLYLKWRAEGLPIEVPAVRK